jgi:hypothetical protein
VLQAVRTRVCSPISFGVLGPIGWLHASGLVTASRHDAFASELGNLGQRRSQGGRAVIWAGRAAAGSGGTLLPMLDVYGYGGERAAGAYGQNGDAVAALLERATALDSLGIERLGSVFGYGNEDASAERRDATVMESAIITVASDRRDAIRTAFLDGQMSVLMACDPKVLALEHWWNFYPEVSAMSAVAYLAAATVVEDRLAPEALAIARRPFDALDHGLPGGLFGPNHDAVVAIVEAVSDLTREQARRIEREWSLEPTGDLANFGFPGPLDEGRGAEGWMPRWKGRRHHAWIELLQRVGPATMAERRFAWATTSARSRIRAAGEPRPTPELRGAIEAAVAATLFEDLVHAALVEELTQPWRSRDADIAPSSWWESNRARFVR